MTKIIFNVPRRRKGNAGLVRNILHGTGAVVGGVVGAAASGIAAGYRTVVGTEVEDAAQPSDAVAPKFFPEAEVIDLLDDQLEGIEDILMRVQSDPKKSDECRLTIADLITEINQKFRGE